MEPYRKGKPVHIIFRYPLKQPSDHNIPQINTFGPLPLEEQIWQWIAAVPGPDSPIDILAELEGDVVTFDWELLAKRLNRPLAEVLSAAASLFERYMGRGLTILDNGLPIVAKTAILQYKNSTNTHLENTNDSEKKSVLAASDKLNRNEDLDRSVVSEDLDNAGMKSVVSLGRTSTDSGPRAVSPVVGFNATTPSSKSSPGNTDANMPSYIGSHKSSAPIEVSIRNKPVETKSEDNVGTGSAPAAISYIQENTKVHSILQSHSRQRHSFDVSRRAHIGMLDSDTGAGLAQSTRDSSSVRYNPAIKGKLPDVISTAVTKELSIADIVPSNISDTVTGMTLSKENLEKHAAQDINKNRAEEDSKEFDILEKPRSLEKDEMVGALRSRSPSLSSSFSDLSNGSVTESAMQDALISEAMGSSTAMSSLFRSRMFPWAKKK